MTFMTATWKVMMITVDKLGFMLYLNPRIKLSENDGHPQMSETERHVETFNFPSDPHVCHFHPIAFVEQMKRMEDYPYCDPLKIMRIRYNRASNLFGKIRDRGTRNHQGFDYQADIGTEVYAVSDGIVELIETNGDYGMQLCLALSNSKYYAFYAHLSEVKVKLNALVHKGDLIALTGVSGNAKGMKGEDQHLHFECRTKLKTGKGLKDRISPNEIVLTKFYSQDIRGVQSNIGVKKVDQYGNEIIMKLIK